MALDGRMQFGVTSPHWVFTGTLGPFGVFHNSRARGWAQVRAPTGGAPPTGSTVTALATGEDGRQQITVHTTGPAVLVRSESWSALIRHSAGAIAAVVGLLVSGAAAAALVVWAFVDGLGAIRHRRRRMAAPSPEVSPD